MAMRIRITVLNGNIAITHFTVEAASPAYHKLTDLITEQGFSFTTSSRLTPPTGRTSQLIGELLVADMKESYDDVHQNVS